MVTTPNNSSLSSPLSDLGDPIHPSITLNQSQNSIPSSTNPRAPLPLLNSAPQSPNPLPSNHNSASANNPNPQPTEQIAMPQPNPTSAQNDVPDPHPKNTHQMCTRSKSGISKPNSFYSLSTTISPIPKSHKIAIQDPLWFKSMKEEFDALIKNKTWDLVPRPSHANVVTGKWLYRHKYDADGKLTRYKSRWVARGYSQQEGIDFDETFSPVVKPATIRTVLSIALARTWPIHQLDVKNAFLHGNLKELVYCQQPPGFVSPLFPNHVYRLNKALYGLKQAPRAWFQRFALYLQRLGFTTSKSDASLFIFQRGTQQAFLLLYIDDIILTASSTPLLNTIISALRKEFSMTDLGVLHYFLGISVRKTSQGLHLSQEKYVYDILQRANMANCNSARTPVDTNPKLHSDAGDSVRDATLYRSLAGALQYLTFTRPDISYAVQQVCLHMHDPRLQHLNALKRIIRYVKGTATLGLQLLPSNINQLMAYSDADWAGCPTSRRSTSGYCMYLGDSLISWSSKRQTTVARSSAEAEYRAVANTVAESCWLRKLLYELRCPIKTATIVFCDNVSAVYLSSNPVQHQRTKHIEIDIHFVREKVAIGEVRVLHVPSAHQFADVLTKGLPYAMFQEFRSSLCVREPPVSTEGE